MEIAKLFPDRIPPEAVIENSDIANKENIIDKIVPVQTVASNQQAVSGEKQNKMKEKA
jgi:hypothetical protein